MSSRLVVSSSPGEMDVDILVLLSWLARHIYLSEDSGLIYFSIRCLKETLEQCSIALVLGLGWCSLMNDLDLCVSENRWPAVRSSRWLVSGSAIEDRTNQPTSTGTQWPVCQLLSKHHNLLQMN